MSFRLSRVFLPWWKCCGSASVSCVILCCCCSHFFSFMLFVSHLCFPDRRSLHTRCLLGRAVWGHRSSRGWLGSRRDKGGRLCMLHTPSYQFVRYTSSVLSNELAINQTFCLESSCLREGFIAGPLHWITFNCTGVHNKLVTKCILANSPQRTKWASRGERRNRVCFDASQVKMGKFLQHFGFR